MILALQRYDFDVSYRTGSELYIADTLSRAFEPLQSSRSCDRFQEQFEHIKSVDDVINVSDERLKQIAQHKAEDETMQM